MLIMAFFLMVIVMALFIRAMIIIPMKRNAIRIAEVAVRNTDVTPVTRC